MADKVADPLRKRIDDARQVEIARVATESADARKQLAEADFKVAQLNLEAEKAKLSYESLRKENQYFVDVATAPYLWVHGSEDKVRLGALGAELDSFPGLPLFIQTIPDFRIQLVAENLARLLREQHGWDVRIVDESTTGIAPKHIMPGTALFVWMDSPAGRSMEPSPSDFDSNPSGIAALSLLQYLGTFIGLASPHILSPSQPICEIDGVIGFALPRGMSRKLLIL